jgi:hypothetical protein
VGCTHAAWATVEWRVHERRPGNLIEYRRLEPPFGSENFGIGTPKICSFMCEQRGHHYLCLGWEVKVARARNDEWVIARSASDERSGREDAENLFENSLYYGIPRVE